MAFKCPECDYIGGDYPSTARHYGTKHDGHILNSIHGFEKIAKLYEEHSENSLSKHLGVSRPAVKKALEENPLVNRRGQSEAEKHKLSKMTAREKKKRIEAAQEATRNLHASYRTNTRGYEAWRCYDNHKAKQETVKVHRLLAVAECGFDEVCGKVVHHKNGLKWDNRPCNIEVMDETDHLQHHYKQREIDEHGRFV